VRKEQKTNRIELRLRDVNQLFNTMDPSPFYDKDLDQDAEEFIENWAREFGVRERVALVVHLEEWPAKEDPQALVEQAVHNYFRYKARMNKREFKSLMIEGGWSLVIGATFLMICLAAGRAVGSVESGTFPEMLKESLVIGGWVAMWRPIEIYLYRWWPLFRRGRIREKLSHMPVKVVHVPPS
jgi:hypothetical protein